MLNRRNIRVGAGPVPARIQRLFMGGHGTRPYENFVNLTALYVHFYDALTNAHYGKPL